MVKKETLWTEQEKFAKYILQHVLRELIQEWFNFNTHLWNYILLWIDEYWVPNWWEQLTDKIIILKFWKNSKEIVETYFFIESKAYLKWISDESVNWSFEQFENKLPQFWNIWYASTYLIFRALEEKSDYYLIKKRIEDDPNLPIHYFEISREHFLNQDDLKNLLRTLKNNVENFDKNLNDYLSKDLGVIEKLKKLLTLNIHQAFSKYETSEKKIDIILDNMSKNQSIKQNIEDINSIEKWFQFDENKNSTDLENATKCQESYQLNKYQYFKNPLIRENIEKIENFIIQETFDEVAAKWAYSILTDCTDSFLDEFNSLTINNQSHKKINDYLFHWWKRIKKWFLFDCWGKEKCLFHYKSDNTINFINKN